MDDDSIQTETELQSLYGNRVNNNDEPILVENLRFNINLNSTIIIKFFSLLAIIITLIFVASLNSVPNIDYKKFNYNKNNLLQIYINSILSNIKTTFKNDFNNYDHDFNIVNENEHEDIDNTISRDVNYEFKQIFDKNIIISNEKNKNYTYLISENTRNLIFKGYKNENENEINTKNKLIHKSNPYSISFKDDNLIKDGNFSVKKFLINEKQQINEIQNTEKIMIDSLKNEKINIERLKRDFYEINLEINNKNISSDESEKFISSPNYSSNKIYSSNIEIDNKNNQTNSNKEPTLNNDLINFNPGEIYFFLNNITQYEYSGKWNGSNPNNMFEKSEGLMNIEIRKNQSSHVFNLLPNIEFYRILEFTFNAKDGDYRDNWMVFNFTLKFPKNFSDNIINNLNSSMNIDKEINKKGESNNSNNTLKDSKFGFVKEKKENEEFNSKANSIILIEDNVEIRYFIAELFETVNVTQCNRSRVELEFIRDPIYKVENFDDIRRIEFSKIKGKIYDAECDFKFDFSLQIEIEDDYSSRVWNYSLVITAISIAEIFYTYKLVVEISNNYQKGKNLSLITVVLNIIWNASLCTGHFFLSLTQEDYSYEYGTPSMTYFLLFSIFELRLLFFTWKSRHNDLFYNDINQFRKKMFKFYSLFYIALFVCLISVKTIFSNVWSSLIYFGATWFFQIIHSAMTGTKPPISFKYILCVSIGKLFPALYLKACPYNIFDLKPKYFIVFIIALLISIQVIILEIQKYIGPKFILPKFLKKLPYNYYVDEKEEEDLNKSKLANDCIICLDSLINPSHEINDIVNDLREIQIKFKDFNCFVLLTIRAKERIKNYILSLKYSHARKKIMKTPCNHFFHNICLEKWLEFKNECPYCRTEIPPLE